jgi:hypothetical protein
MAKWDWAGLAVVAAIGIAGYFLGLPWWAIGIIGGVYAAIRIVIEVATRPRGDAQRQARQERSR